MQIVAHIANGKLFKSISEFFSFIRNMLQSFEAKKEFTNVFDIDRIIALFNSSEMSNEIVSISRSPKPPCVCVELKNGQKYRVFNNLKVILSKNINVQEAYQSHEYLRDIFNRGLRKDRFFLVDYNNKKAITIITRTFNGKNNITCY